MMHGPCWPGTRAVGECQRVFELLERERRTQQHVRGHLPLGDHCARRAEGRVRPWGSEICSSCRGWVVVLVEDTAEAVASADVAGRGVIERGDGTRRFGRAQLEGAVGPMFVVVAHIDAQYVFKLVARDDQHAVEAFLAQGSDPTLGDRVRVGGPHRRSDDADAVGSKGGGELGVAALGSETECDATAQRGSWRGCGLVG